MNKALIGIGIVIVVVIAGAWWYANQSGTPTASNTPTSTTTGETPATSTAGLPADTHGMKLYTDADFGVSFWYPETLSIKETTQNDTKEFPGATLVKTIQVGPTGGVTVYEVTSSAGTITDEPVRHASPIAATKYFFDQTSSSWMVAYPESTSKQATTTADVSQQTVGGLPILASGRRFDTSIIPLSSAKFIVVSDGGGASFTRDLAKTVYVASAQVPTDALGNALAIEAAAATTTPAH